MMNKILTSFALATLTSLLSATASATYVQTDDQAAYSAGPGFVFVEWRFAYDFSENNPSATLSVRCDDGCPLGTDLSFNGNSLAGVTPSYAMAGPGEEGFLRYFVFALDPGWLRADNRAQLYTDSFMEVSGAKLTIEGSEVPLPATAWLFGSALAGLALRRKNG